MELNTQQTRRLFLAGTVAFPTPYPTVGGVSIELGTLTYSKDAAEEKTFVVVEEQPERTRFATRLILKRDVAAIFFPRARDADCGSDEVFKFSKKYRVDDFERGEWFLTPEICVEAIRTRLKLRDLDIDVRGGAARGVVFVYEDRPVRTVYEITEPAGSVEPSRWGCECCKGS